MERKIIEIDLSSKTVKDLPMPEEYQHLGGRGLTSSILSAELDPLCHPLSSANTFVIAPGYLAGIIMSSCNRLSVGAKSPLTGGIKESNSGYRDRCFLPRHGGLSLQQGHPFLRHGSPRGNEAGAGDSSPGLCGRL
ncbi:aldehyde ferredoxin oxidoreductase N-terminal domain-containing protein [Marispirochaeta sp.]|uniref:aldehyde ferredoxin oxidoreductase N-terminal domain-containing protein n=1 Tax=Marispirochaeta sp. TaxID=2038653 RepID=UPI0029C75154|nr:aldehyde ferredoxin oxidoreductase N-terminal domain-containing protein [Marispirochaeta sp.]